MIHAQDVKYVSVTPPAAIVDNAPYPTAEIDRIGYDYATIIVYLGATDIAMSALTVTESDTSGSGHGNVTGLIYGTSTDIDGSTSSLPSATDDNGFFIFEIDLRGRKRYLDVTATAGDGSAGTFATILCILSRAGIGNDSIADSGATGILRVP
jgi:hypothetical protein